MPRLDPRDDVACIWAVRQEQAWAEASSAVAVGSAILASPLIVIANLGVAVWLTVPAVLLLGMAAFAVVRAIVHHRRYLQASRALMALQVQSLGDRIQRMCGSNL